jgi:hypothetical protein|tara:strand:- start:5276 stop:5419 length:144 start_codon:yes stop_codon:yes gene_type:complete
MKKEYINKKELKITDAKKFPSDWWNYLVNPIVGYYIPKADKKRNPKL